MPASGVAVGAPPAADGKSYAAATLPGASQSNGCTPGTPCVGDMTFYNPSQGLGACGSGPDSYVYQDTDFVVAVSHEMMGSLSSGEVENALCWRVLHITNPATGKSNRGMVVDKCAGCVSFASPSSSSSSSSSSSCRVRCLECWGCCANVMAR